MLDTLAGAGALAGIAAESGLSRSAAALGGGLISGVLEKYGWPYVSGIVDGTYVFSTVLD